MLMQTGFFNSEHSQQMPNPTEPSNFPNIIFLSSWIFRRGVFRWGIEKFRDLFLFILITTASALLCKNIYYKQNSNLNSANSYYLY